jgi:ABC-type multidrug transport system ATPase subunit
MIPASAKFYDGASVDFAVRLYLTLRGADVPRDIFESYDPFSLREYARAPFGDLSLGWKKRVMLHMAFASDSTVLVLDEPTVGLDVGGVERLTVLTCHESTALSGLSVRKYALDPGTRGSVLLSSGDAEL